MENKGYGLLKPCTIYDIEYVTEKGRGLFQVATLSEERALGDLTDFLRKVYDDNLLEPLTKVTNTNIGSENIGIRSVVYSKTPLSQLVVSNLKKDLGFKLKEGSRKLSKIA